MNPSCIRKNSKDFKILVEKFNVDVDTLAEIIYRYYELTNSEDNFPSDIYIQAQLGKAQYVDNSPSIKKLWDLKYNKPKNFTTEAELQAAKNEALTVFPSEAVIVYKDTKGNYILAIKEPVKEYKPKYRIDFNSWQEYNDYLLAMGDMVPQEKRDKEEQVVGEQPFTFKDGTTVTVPFRPNEQQVEALNVMNDFIKSDETTMTLSGYAGTGKTSLMEIIAAKAKKEGENIIFSASTNKAAAVLRDRVKSQGFTAQTLNKIFGIQVVPDEGKPYDADNLTVLLKEADIVHGSIVVIDEASMINGENYDLLNKIAEQNHLKIIFVGDKGQLAPVKESQISKVFRNNNGRVVNLTKVERTGDNAILKEATDVRNGQPLSMESSFNKQGKGVAYVKKSNKTQLKQIVEKFVPFLKQNPDFFRILAYTNAAVARYNKAVREALGYTDNTPRVGEPIVGYNNWGRHYDRRTKTTIYDFVNSESYKVTKVGTHITLRKVIDSGTEVQLQALPITLVDTLGNKQIINFVDVKDNTQNRQAAMILAQEKARLFNVAKQTWGKAKAELVAAAYDLENFLFINDDLKDGGRTLQKKYFDFGYAMTVHKSQGSTFKHVLIDDTDIAIARNSTSNWENAVFGENIALPQDSNFDASDMTVAESGNLFDLMSQPEAQSTMMETTIPSSDNNSINMRQQLEYVAVSRATDTVTIIANDANVKKEDSPLNHLPQNPVESDTTANHKEILQQLTHQLEIILTPLGNKVHGLADMQKYLQEHPEALSGVQQAIAGSQLSFAHGVKTPTGEDKILLSSAIMTQANTFEHLTELLNENIGSVAKRGIFFGDNAYLWSTENGYEFFIEQSLSVNEKNYDAINQLLQTYGTDTFTTSALNSIQRSKDKKTRSRSLADFARQQRDRISARPVGFISRQISKIPNTTRDNGNTLANTQGQGTEQFFIGKKARTQFEQSLRKARPDMTDAEIQSTLDFLHSLDDNKENTAYIKTAVRWVANRSITMPQDNVRVRQAFDLARKKHLDLQKYNTLGELIASDEMKPKEKEKKAFDPDKAKTFSNKRTVTTEGGRVFTVYDVENTEEGQREVCKALAAHYEMSPWCISTFTATGEPTQSAKRYWNHYNALPRKIAYENGKPVAFNSNTMPNQGKAVFKGMEVSHSSGNFNGYYISEENVGPISLMESLVKEGLLREDKETGYYQFTEKGEQALFGPDAWWDMENSYPQNTLSDAIVSTPEAIGRGEQQAMDALREDMEREQREYLELMQNEGIEEDDFDLPFFLTPQGEVYGFVAPNGDIYLDETKISPEHPIHEYTHLWDRIIAKKNPKLWNRGVELMKQTSEWQKVLNDANYGQRWKSLKGMTDSKLEQLIASEVHARFVGKGGQQLLDKIAKEKGAKGIISKLKQWILDVWKDLKATFSNWSDEDLQKLTLKDFNHMTMRDFADALNFNTAQDSSTDNNQTTPMSYEGLITPEENTIFVFGSNPEGRHGAGAAKTAREKFGAIYGQGEGLQGNSYALPTKDLRSKPVYSEDGGKTPVVMYRGYALTENREAYNIAETIGHTAVDYDESLKGAIYFTSSKEEAQDYAKGRTDKSPEPPTQENPQGRPINRHYTGDYAKVSRYFIAPNAKVERYKDIRDYIKNSRNSNADVIVLDKGTAFSDNTEYIVKNPSVIVYDKMLRSISPEQITENIRKMYDVARQHPDKQFKVAYTNRLNEATLNGYTGAEMIKMFKDAGPIPSNVVFSKNWTDHWNEVKSSQTAAYNAIYSAESRSIDEQLVTVAPYFRQKLTSKNQTDLEQATKEVRQKAQKLADTLGLKIEAVETVAGTYLGSSEISYQYRIQSTDQEKVDLFAALMGDLSFEYQDAVIAANYTTDKSQTTAYELVYQTPKGTTIEDIEATLKELGIEGSCFSFETNQLSITGFSEQEVQEIINKLKDSKYEYKEYNPQNSRYLDNEYRRDAYKRWLNSKDGQQNRQLNNACSKALTICEAAARFPEESQESERLKAAQEAAEQWDAEHLSRQPQTTSREALVPEASSSTQTSQKVSLPGYEYFNELYEDTEVDAAWKIPLLQDLDSQLAIDNPDNNKILEQMDRILQSPSEEGYYKAPTAERQEVNEKMTDYERRNTQMNALMDNNVGLRASEIRDIAEDIVNSISDIITEIQNNPDAINKYFPTIKPKNDLSKATRKEIVSIIGINNFIAEAKKRFENLRYDESNPEVWELYNEVQLLDQADLILNNWETMVELAADLFVINEGLSLERDTAKQTFKTNEHEFTGYDYDNYVDPQDEDALKEEKDEQEHWQVVVRTIDAFNSMSELVKLAIHECYELDRDGNKILGKFGTPKRVNKVIAVNNILRWTQGTLNINDMIQKIDERAERKPWVTQLTKRLRDTSGKETDLQSQFFSVMHRHFQLYGIGQLENGIYTSKILNNSMALSKIIKDIGTQFRLQAHPLFHDNGKIKKDCLDTLKKWFDQLDSFYKAHGIMHIKSIGIVSDEKTEIKKPLTAEDIQEVAKLITAVSRMLGYNATESSVQNIITAESLYTMWTKLRFIVEKLEKEFNSPTTNYNPLDFNAKNNIRNEVIGFLTPVVEELEDDTTNAFFDNGNMYQSFVIPSFLTQLFDQFHQSSEQFTQWVEKFYGQSEWFKERGINGRWKNEWLRRMVGDIDARKLFNHKVQLNFNKHDYMRNMSPEELTLSIIMEYFSETFKANPAKLEEVPAWFRVPLQSNKPSSEFIRFYADRSPHFKDNIVNKMCDMFFQELSRIDTVRKRNKTNKDDAIQSFDEQGRKFQFLPWLNSFLMDNGKLVGTKQDLFFNEDGTPDTQKASELKHLLNKKLDAKSPLSKQEEAHLNTLVKEATKNFMQMRSDNIIDSWKQSGILKASEKIKGIKSLNNSVKDNLENFLWNDFFAANQILQLTIVDKAFYPNATELQKRLAELHAPGVRGNKYAVDYSGKRVSDGNYRTILIRDFDGFITNIIENISIVFDRKIAAAPESEKAGLIALKESLVGENGAYRRINVTDGQAYSSPSSYRKKAIMFGKWSPKAEEIYQRLLRGDFSITDLEVAFQPLKPFVYGHLNKQIGTEGITPITNMPIPFQAKNSEYLLITADALLRGQETGRPNLLKAIFDIMEQSHYDEGHYGEKEHYRTTGIDTVQFESAIKSGAQGIIDITSFIETSGGEAGAFTLMKNLIYQEENSEDGTKYNYNSFVHKTDYDNYALQQEVPAHFREHQQAEGSQQRMNIPADLDFYNYDGEVNTYSWKDPDGTEHNLNAIEFRKEYERVHATNIENSFNLLIKELHLDSEDKKARNLALSEILQNEIISSPRYGLDLFIACQIDPRTNEFRIPKGDPIQSKRIEQLCNSIIKNRVNKQKISGGPIVQVTNFGTSQQLHIRFHDKNGGLLMTKEEYEKSHQVTPTSQTDKFNAKFGKFKKSVPSVDKSYQQYLKENQAGIAHFEIFAPIGMKKLFDKFKNPDGSINLEAVERCDPELLKVITGRIPNEDKYSIAHGKIVGFMPALAGDAIMFPYELTEIDDSDFDVDKRYTMQKEIDILEDREKIENHLFQVALEGYKKSYNGEPSREAKKKLSNEIKMFLDDPERMKTSDRLQASLYKEYQKFLQEEYPYKTKYPQKGSREANNNQIIDMSWAVMSNEMTADKILNPGGFEVPKHEAYVIAAYKNSDGTISWEKLEGMSTKELQKLSTSEKDLAWLDTHVQFYKQNAAGSNLIGVFAVNKVAHATLEGDGIYINVTDFCGETPFKVCDTEFKEMMPLDSAKDSKGQLIGKNIGSGVGASADTAKDPWLDMININMTTAGMFNALMRLGMPMADAELFMAQDVISRLIREFNSKSLAGEKTSLDKLIQEKLNIIWKKNSYSVDSEINSQPLTREELKKGLMPVTDIMSDEREAIEYKTLLAFSKIKVLTKAIRKPTLVTRLNSISAAVGPLIIDNIILEHKLQQFLSVNADDSTGFYIKTPSGFKQIDMDDLLEFHPILKQFSRPIDSRNQDCPTQRVFGDMPAGSRQFKTVLNALPDNVKDTIYSDRQLLLKLSDFYQSYLLIANGVIKSENLKDYIEHYPEFFVGKGTTKDGKARTPVKEQYPNNAFIQAIQLNYDKKFNRAFLSINTTGMKEQEKEKLRMAWTDLHKINPTLSTQLFTYAFFRGGIGFSPKTWMGLVPTYVKEHLNGYVNTYRHFPRINPDIVIEQFILNNWNNSKLVPKKGGEDTNYNVDLERGTLIAVSENDVKDLKGIKYMKTEFDGKTYLWKLLGKESENKSRRYYVRVDPLGNNGEYMEMSNEANKQAVNKTTQLIDNTETQEIPELSPYEQEESEIDALSEIPISEDKQSQKTAEIVPLIMLQNKVNEQEAKTLFNNFKERTKNGTLASIGFKKYLVNLFKNAGLNLTLDEAFEKFKEFC